MPGIEKPAEPSVVRLAEPPSDERPAELPSAEKVAGSCNLEDPKERVEPRVGVNGCAVEGVAGCATEDVAGCAVELDAAEEDVGDVAEDAPAGAKDGRD